MRVVQHSTACAAHLQHDLLHHGGAPLRQGEGRVVEDEASQHAGGIGVGRRDVKHFIHNLVGLDGHGHNIVATLGAAVALAPELRGGGRGGGEGWERGSEGGVGWGLGAGNCWPM